VDTWFLETFYFGTLLGTHDLGILKFRKVSYFVWRLFVFWDSLFIVGTLGFGTHGFGTLGLVTILILGQLIFGTI
jgi:hypothetical protein